MDEGLTFFPTPTGAAGSDQVHALEESVHGHLEQMFQQGAKWRALSFGVGRTVQSSSTDIDGSLRLDAQKRECQGSVAFHAARAVELALQVVHARGTDRIPGREFPGAPKAVINEDRNTHSLAQLYKRVVVELTGRPMTSAFEDVYQTTRHAGLVDIVVDGKCKQTMYLPECAPFREVTVRRMTDGAEQTIDHLATRDGHVADIGNLFLPLDLETDFQALPEETFEDFLQKADRVYYKSDIPKNGEASRRGIRWEHYSARDHEYGRPYVVVGSLFFARLARGIVGLSRAPWTWDEKFANRWYARRQRNIRRSMELQLEQNFESEVELPQMIGVDEAMRRFRELSRSRMNDRTSYDHLHGRVEVDTEDARAS